jgi:hypothetical protein
MFVTAQAYPALRLFGSVVMLISFACVLLLLATRVHSLSHQSEDRAQHAHHDAARCPCVPQVGAKRLTLLELLSAYRSVPMDLQTLANLLPRLGPR